eukprot:s3759_g1.t1
MSKKIEKVNHVPDCACMVFHVFPDPKMFLVFLLASKTSCKSLCPINRNADLKSESANQRPVWYSENHTYEVHGEKRKGQLD